MIRQASLKEFDNLPYNNIISKNISNLSSKFVIESVFIKIIGYLIYIGCLKCIKPWIKPRLIITSPKSSIKPLSQAITSEFRPFTDK